MLGGIPFTFSHTLNCAFPEYKIKAPGYKKFFLVTWCFFNLIVFLLHTFREIKNDKNEHRGQHLQGGKRKPSVLRSVKLWSVTFRIYRKVVGPCGQGSDPCPAIDEVSFCPEKNGRAWGHGLGEIRCRAGKQGWATNTIAPNCGKGGPAACSPARKKRCWKPSSRVSSVVLFCSGNGHSPGRVAERVLGTGGCGNEEGNHHEERALDMFFI